jgi:hypothetical protein
LAPTTSVLIIEIWYASTVEDLSDFTNDEKMKAVEAAINKNVAL